MTPRTLPTTAQLVTPIVAGAAVLLAAATLTGCSALLNELRHVHEESHPSYPAAAEEWVGVPVPAWIPTDATTLHNVATHDETQSVIAVSTPSEPVGCEAGSRTSMPFMTTKWAPAEVLLRDDGSLVDEVLRCGDYEVAPYGDGWVGWFSARTQGQTPR